MYLCTLYTMCIHSTLSCHICDHVKCRLMCRFMLYPYAYTYTINSYNQTLQYYITRMESGDNISTFAGGPTQIDVKYLSQNQYKINTINKRIVEQIQFYTLFEAAKLIQWLSIYTISGWILFISNSLNLKNEHVSLY